MSEFFTQERLKGFTTELEHKNGIYTPAQRLLAASLLVEPTFLYPAVISGQKSGFEHAFGKEKWANYLSALQFTNSYDGPLTVNFVLNVYGHLLGNIWGGIVQDTQFEKGQLGVGSNAGEPIPMIGNGTMIANIRANPYLEWLPVTKPINDAHASRLSKTHPVSPYLLAKHGWAVTDESSLLGFINYVYKTREEKLRELGVIVDTYNNVEEPHDPDERAALLGKRLVSLHAGPDLNGTAANLLRNWSLRRDGLGPSIPDPDDLITTDEQHIDYVRSGRAIYEDCRQKVVAGTTDPVVILGLESGRALFNNNIMATRLTLEPDGLHDRLVFDRFRRSPRCEV